MIPRIVQPSRARHGKRVAFGRGDNARPLRIFVDEANAAQSEWLDLIYDFAQHDQIEVVSSDKRAPIKLTIKPYDQQNQYAPTIYEFPDGRTSHSGVPGPDIPQMGREVAGPGREDEGEKAMILAITAEDHGSDALVVAVYNYEDAAGQLVQQVIRGDRKQFPQRRPDPSSKTGWRWNLQGVTQVPYRLPRLLEQCQLGGTVHVVEGEKDVHAVERAGGVATTNPGGAGKWRDAYSQHLRGAGAIVIVADNDPAGLAHAGAVAGSLRSVLAAECPPVSDVTLREHAERYLAVHAAAPRTKAKLREDLGLPEREPKQPRKLTYKTAIQVFGERTLRDLEHARGEIAEWVAQLPEPQRQRRLRALRQILNAAVAWEKMLRNPASGVRAGAVRAPEVVTFSDTAEIDALAFELGSPWAQLVVFATESGLRPEEWIAVERRDVRGDVVTVQRAYTVEGGAKEYGKTSRSRRSVPLSDRALAALDDLPARIDSPLLWPIYSHGGKRGRPVHLNLANWRKRIWKPALEAAGLQRDGQIWQPGPYSMRHAFATWMLDAGIEVFELARLMGTSVAMIDKTYGHLAKGHVERVRERMNARPTIATEHESEAGDA
jgi:integrase